MIAVIDYGASNLQSVCNGLEKLGQPFEVVSSPEKLVDFRKVILPGVGAAGQAMERLRQTGFSRILPDLKVPCLGICLGLQLFAENSEEDEADCLSIVPGTVKRFSRELKTPQIGWNRVEFVKKNRLTEGIPTGSYFYFVNSYYLPTNDAYTTGTTLYGVSFSSMVQKDNFYAVQFHTEKSGEIGLQLLSNFCEKC